MKTLRHARAVVSDWIDREGLRSPARLVLSAFAFVILIFTGLLSLPAATVSGERADFIDALFTATSAVCVTGLVTQETGAYWSPLGLTIIAVGIKIGGLGIMTLASLLALMVSRRLGLTQRRLAAHETKATGLGDVKSLLRVIVSISVTVEVIIAIALLPRFLMLGYDTGTSVGYSAFYAISAFNNAGFAPNVGGATVFASDFWILAPIALGVWVGALGFPVYLVLMRQWRHPRRWTLHAKLTLVTVTVLTFLSAGLLALFEWNNPDTLGQFGVADKWGNVFFQSVNQRSGGFNSIEVSDMYEQTWLMEIVLMFIGGGSGSTAGGIRLTTFAVIILAIVAEARGRRDLEAFGKRIGTEVLRVAVSVVVLGLSLVIIGTGIFMYQTGIPLAPSLYEVVSAYATCGLSTGITQGLDPDAKYTLTIMMYLGRVGSMTLAAALALNQQRRVIRYPSERPIIG
ncbi:MAG: potassium transporter Trk [Actinobacteria bacterium HGW-Actinobacteria-4]|nr:MAG: potassium transporter Trk [Actinobacteria bacterium HGW-Actinobacteria-4]